MNDSNNERLTRLLSDCYDDPDVFNSVILQRPPFRGPQVGWCRDLVEYRCLAIETGNMLGKDYWIGGIVPWWLCTRENSLVIVTGPGQTILGSVTWKEIRKAIHGSPFSIGAKISQGIKTSPHTVVMAPGWQALGYSTTSVERASGQHAGQLLVIVEEASGVEPEAWDALESLGYTKLVAIGNPLRPEGGFVDLCNQAASDKARSVPKREATCYRNVPSTAGPDAHLVKSPYGLADQTWIDACRRKYGEDSLWYRAHVLAIRPALLNEQLIPTADLDRCITAETAATVAMLRGDKEKAARLCGKKRIGCDVGEGVGNARSVIIARDDLGIIAKHASRYTGPGDAAEAMVMMAQELGIPPEQCSYDGAGQTGKRLGNALAKRGFERARPFFGSASGGKRCTNLRTACALALARRLDRDHFAGSGFVWHPFAIEPDSDWEAMREELLGLRYHLQGDQSALEKKDEFMERLGRSPDYSDALCQTFRQEAVEG